MPRNLDKRVEIMFPVEDEDLKERIIKILLIQLEDNVKSHILLPDGTYEKPDRRGRVQRNSQEEFCEEAKLAVREELKKLNPQASRVFIPNESQS